MSLPIDIRPAQPSDTAFVLAAWMRALTNQRHYGPEMEGDDLWLVAMQALIRLTLSQVPTHVAHRPGHPDQAYGFVVAEDRACNPVLHWVYVKHLYRREQIATRLLQHAITNFGECNVHAPYMSNAFKHHRSRWRLHHRPDRLHGLMPQSE